MHLYRYKARDGHGKLVTDDIKAAAPAEALRQLQRAGLTVLQLAAADAGAPAPGADAGRIALRHAAASVQREHVIDLAQQMSIMLDTGVTLSETLAAYIAQSKHRGMRRVVAHVQHRVVGGEPLSDALAQFPRLFPRLMVSLVAASEASGSMGEMLGRIANYLDKDRQAVRQIRGALTYPLIMLTMSLAVSGFLIAWVLPRFAKIYAQREAALPLPTKIVLGLSDALVAHWPWIAGGAAAAGVLLGAAVGAGPGRRALDRIKLRVPVIGPIYTRYYLTRAARTLGTLLAAGVQLLDAVRIVRGVTGNAAWDDFWTRLEQRLTSGGTLTEVALGSKLLPPSAAQMVAAGERTGRLPDVLDRIANSTERELDDAIKQGTQLIEPAMIIFMGGLIGGLALALLLPIFTIANTMSG